MLVQICNELTTAVKESVERSDRERNEIQVYRRKGGSRNYYLERLPVSESTKEACSFEGRAICGVWTYA